MVTTHDSRPVNPPRLAVIGGGPVGLALALLMRQRCPAWSVSSSGGASVTTNRSSGAA